jgi:hypothetical protein
VTGAGLELPAPARKALRDRAAALADAVVEVMRDVPDPATLRNLRIGAQAAVERFLERLEDGDGETDLDLFVAHGRAQRAAGRPLPELLAFYRRGGAAIWEQIAALPALRELERDTLVALGAATMAWVDELSGAALEGFSAQEAASRAAERARRDHLSALLLGREPGALEEAAAAAGWPVPVRLRAAVAALGEPGAASGAVPARVLVTDAPGRSGHVLLFLPDDEETADWARRAAAALGLRPPVALGPAVAPQAAAVSARLAGALLDLGPDAELPRAEDHEVELLLAADPELAAALAARRLSPLDGLPAGARSRMEQTLAAWLAHPDRPQAIADDLGLHVQTVRYRLARLRERFGADLDDPAVRLELDLALRERRMRG